MNCRTHIPNSRILTTTVNTISFGVMFWCNVATLAAH